MPAETPSDISSRLERCFKAIESERMAGIPILNRAIAVSAVGTRAWGDEWLSVLVTPWFMSIVLMPRVDDGEADRSVAAAASVGAKQSVAFPSGRFEFITGHEPSLGTYRMCSLFSPMFEFPDHDTAVATAAAALEALLAGDEKEVATDDDGMAMIWRGEKPAAAPETEGAAASGAGETRKPAGNTVAVSRRGFLRGRDSAREGT
ncbi:MAG: [NiFe]-hydrogenase assembly chaperone HybE [Hyphomicrobiaceae bacterium]|nr:[NiFe]-hydrogenase assembly chaperone HybE [Hyphomicrobiaceae bacterium]